MATEKMQRIKKEIEKVMFMAFPDGYLNYVFGGKLTPDDVVTQVLIECCKQAYDKTAEKHSLRHYFRSYGIEEENEQRWFHRSLEKANQYRKAEYDLLSERGMEYPELLPPPMDTIDQKKEGYSLNPFQFWELNNIKEMRLVGSIVDKRISKKNTTLQDIEDLDLQYCDILQDIGECDDRIFAFLSMFTLEWKYSFDFIYEVADAMKRNGVTYSDELGKRLSAFCGRVSVNSCINAFAPVPAGISVPGCTVNTESRLLLPRRRYIADILDGGEADEPFSETHRFLEGLVVVSLLCTNMTLHGIPVFEWFRKDTDRSDWTSVFEDYDVYSALVTDKDWTRKTVRNLKSIYDSISFDYKS